MSCASLDKVAPVVIMAAKNTKNHGLKICQTFGCSRERILARLFWQHLLKINLLFNPPMIDPAATASQIQHISGFSNCASVSKQYPFRSNTIPPIYQINAARILRIRVDAVNIDI